MTEQPTFDVTPPGWRPATPVDGQTFDEYRWSQLVEENRALKARQEALTREIEAILAHLDILESVRDAVGGINGRVTSIDERLRMLEDAGKPAPKPVDVLNEKILAFLNANPNVKFTAISIKENIGDGKYIHDRCKTLVRQGLIRMHAEPNRHPLYQALEKKVERAEDQPT